MPGPHCGGFGWNPMECKKIREKISLFIDEQLSEQDKKLFEGHIASCAECRQLLEETRQALSSIKGTVPPALPPDFLARLDERLDKESTRADNRAAWLFPWKSVAAVLSVILVVVIAKETVRPPAVILQNMKSAPATLESRVDRNRGGESSVLMDKTVPGAVSKQKTAPKPAGAPGEYIARSMPEQAGGSDEFSRPAPLGQTRQSKQEYSPEVNVLSAPSAESEQVQKKDTRAPARSRGTYNEQEQLGVTGFMSTSMTSTISDGSNAAPRILPVQDQWKGYSSGVASPLRMTIKNQNEWESLLQRHAGGSPAPAVDFKHYMAIAVFMGEKTSGGYAVTINRVTVGQTLTVYYREESPSRDSMTSAILTRPYHIIIVERSSLPVVFQSEP